MKGEARGMKEVSASQLYNIAHKEGTVLQHTVCQAK